MNIIHFEYDTNGYNGFNTLVLNAMDDNDSSSFNITIDDLKPVTVGSYNIPANIFYVLSFFYSAPYSNLSGISNLYFSANGHNTSGSLNITETSSSTIQGNFTTTMQNGGC